MKIVWTEQFLQRHVVIVDELLSRDELIQRGRDLFADRLKKSKGKIRRRLMQAGNTLVITSQAGFREMCDWVAAHGKHGAKACHNWIPITVGGIVQTRDVVEGVRVGSRVGKIHVAIRKTQRAMEVYHLRSCKLSTAAGPDPIPVALASQDAGQRVGHWRSRGFGELRRIASLIEDWHFGRQLTVVMRAALSIPAIGSTGTSGRSPETPSTHAWLRVAGRC